MKKKTPSSPTNLKSKNSKPQFLQVLIVEDSEDDALLKETNIDIPLIIVSGTIGDKYSIRIFPTVLFLEKGALSKRLDGAAGAGLQEKQLVESVIKDYGDLFAYAGFSAGLRLA